MSNRGVQRQAYFIVVPLYKHIVSVTVILYRTKKAVKGGTKTNYENSSKGWLC